MRVTPLHPSLTVLAEGEQQHPSNWLPWRAFATSPQMVAP